MCVVHRAKFKIHYKRVCETYIFEFPATVGQHHLIVPCTLAGIVSQAMIDSGATGYSFVDESFAHDQQMTLIPLRHARDVQMFDGSPPISGMITHVVRGQLSLDQHTETTFFFVTKLSGYEVILGIPWLRKHNPTIDWPLNQLTFSSGHCRTHCLRHRLPLSIQGHVPERKHEAIRRLRLPVRARLPVLAPR